MGKAADAVVSLDLADVGLCAAGERPYREPRHHAPTNRSTVRVAFGELVVAQAESAE
jgi:hypothetical protein